MSNETEEDEEEEKDYDCPFTSSTIFPPGWPFCSTPALCGRPATAARFRRSLEKLTEGNEEAGF